MLNFSYYNPVRVEFGQGAVGKLSNLIPEDARILITYGGGSAKRNGSLDQAKTALAGRAVFEFGGIEPNPRYETCMQAVELVKQEKIDFLLAIGGGSVVDGTKFIAAASLYQGEDPWEILLAIGKGIPCPVQAALPLGCIMTLPATGSEMNPTAVISRNSTNEKLHFATPLVFPQFSIIDPEFTKTLPERQTANGIVDTFVHTCEQYMTYEVNALLECEMSEGVLRTLIDQGGKVLADPQNYDIRANLSWCATVGLNGWLACGVPEDWATHMIGHELTAIYGLDHARTLAIVMPALWRKLREQKHDRLLQYARKVWNIADADEAAIDRAIVLTEEFFHSLGVATSLKDYGIDPEEAATLVAERFAARKVKHGELGNIDAKLTAEILQLC